MKEIQKASSSGSHPGIKIERTHPPIKVYIKDRCGLSGYTVKHLKEAGVIFEEIHINDEVKEMLKKYGYEDECVVTIGGFGNSFSGYNPIQIEQRIIKEFYGG